MLDVLTIEFYLLSKPVTPFFEVDVIRLKKGANDILMQYESS